MRKVFSNWTSAIFLSGGLALSTSLLAAQTAAGQQSSAPAAQVGTSTQTPKATRRHYTRRSNASRSAAKNSASTSSGASTQVGPTDEQRRRDQLILAVQKQQSAEIARQNAVTTGNVQKERAAQQAEPRIQDAPGLGSQPLPGEPAVAPAQSSEAPRIQDAPGPAQTLPQAPPPQAAPQTAPQQ